MKCCGTCKYGRYDYASGYVCVNDASDYVADYVEYDFACEDWEKKEANCMASLLKKYGRAKK